MIIAVPGSSLVVESEFDVLEEHIIELLRFFEISVDDFNIGLVLYGQSPIPILYPQPFKTRQQAC